MRKVLMVLLGSLFVLAGCGDGPTEPEDEGVVCTIGGDDGQTECHD